MKLPKFLYSKAENVPSAGEYIIHTQAPACIGKIERTEGKVRVNLVEQYSEMTLATQLDMCLKMKNWFYFSIEAKKQD